MPGYALLFPGQGSQYVGMGQDLHATSAAARAVFEAAAAAGHKSLQRLVFAGPAEELTDTVNAQPALFVTSMACWAALTESLAGAPPRPAFVAGHSLGEYTALAVAGAIPFNAALALVLERGRAMRAAGEAQPGMMAAVLGLATAEVEGACRKAAAEVGQVVVVANDNAPGQIVISGAPEAVRAAGELAKARGARRVIPLAVSIGAHSPLMEPARARFAPALARAGIRAPELPIIGNREATPLTTATEVIAELDAQLVSPVRWTATIQYMVEQGVSTFIEVGPKDVLTGLGRRIAPAATFVACGTTAQVEQAAQLLRAQAV
jgi:[acyl-carrier-protein] S-malonyltransferase